LTVGGAEEGRYVAPEEGFESGGAGDEDGGVELDDGPVEGSDEDVGCVCGCEEGFEGGEADDGGDTDAR
jgi:hypothetical protein